VTPGAVCASVRRDVALVDRFRWLSSFEEETTHAVKRPSLRAVVRPRVEGTVGNMGKARCYYAGSTHGSSLDKRTCDWKSRRMCRTSAEVMVSGPNQNHSEHREVHKNAKGILVLLVHLRGPSGTGQY
jgi:hypothetical protein